MPETYRRCHSCQAPIEFDPASGALRCAYCGATRAIAAGSAPRAHRLEDAGVTTARALEGAVQAARCTGCGAEAELAVNVVATRCAFCSAPLEVRADAHVSEPAESVVAFRLDRTAASAAFQEWLKGLWFRPSDLARLSRLRELRGVYVPAWVFGAHAESRWTAEAGYHYWVEETVESGGRRETRRVQKTRWERVSGHHSGDYEDVVVSASRGLPPEELVTIDPFEHGAARAFDGDFLAGFEAETHATGSRESWPVARERIHRDEEHACASEVPGDTHRALHVDTDTSDEHFRSALLPVYVAAFEYAGRLYRVLVNGQTGLVAGKAPWSWIKITLFVLALALVAGAIWYLSEQQR